MPDKNVRTRFAPSPTGVLHLGSARTAYYNWLYAKKHNGKFLVRVEDTDAKRNDYSQLNDLLSMLKWLGLDYDELLYQSHNINLHIQTAYELLECGAAYRCYMTKEELASKQPNTKLISPWRDKVGDPAQPHVIRLKIPEGKSWSFEDQVQGNITVESKGLNDIVLLRSDGTPTYVLAGLADDHYQQIRTVIRGCDHITNTAQQLPMYDALGWDRPTFAHIPLVNNESGEKLSKRRGAQNISELRDAGYLPEAICNAILRIGWAHKDEEIVDKTRALELFDLTGINAGAARFDQDKLDHLNAHYMRQMPREEIMAHFIDWPEADRARVEAILEEAIKRSVTINGLKESLLYCKEDTIYDVDTNLPIAALCDSLSNADFSSLNDLEAKVRQFAKDHNLKFGPELAQPLRQILTGSDVSPGLFHVMSALGKDLVIKRIMHTDKKKSENPGSASI